MPGNLENSAVATELEKVSFHSNPKEGLDKDRNGTNITEADVKKRWQEYTEELYKKIFKT